MSTAAICVIAVCALLAFAIAACVVMSFVESVLVSGAMTPACPCRAITSITVPKGHPFPRPTISNLVPGDAEDAARKVH